MIAGPTDGERATDRGYRAHDVEAWETAAPGPYVTIETPRGIVTFWAIRDERVRVIATGAIDEQHVVHGCHREAQQLAHWLADRMS